MGFDSFEKVRNFTYKCKTCSKEVPSGIVNISSHWTECTGKFFTEELMKKAEETKGRLSHTTMTKQQFIDKWKLQSMIGYGSAQMDCSKELKVDLNKLLKAERKAAYIAGYNAEETER